MYNDCFIVFSDEIRGDPELGGWRPLPKNFFRKEATLPPLAPVISLEQGVALVNFEFRYLRLLRAVQKVAIGLLQTQSIFTKRGMQCL